MSARRRVPIAAAWLCTLIACTPHDREAEHLTGGSVERGRVALRQYACSACHVIPGVTGAEEFVGPPLNGIASRRYLAGLLPNTPENMALWIQDPQGFKPDSAMPDMGVSDAHARDMVAYLYTLR